MAKKTRRITEQFAVSLDGQSRVDRAAGVIHGVRICGEKSANNRVYPRKVREASCPKYEGAKVYFDHAPNQSRRVKESAGWLSSVKADANGDARGDLNLLLTDPLTPKVLEAAERNPNQFGMSHVAECKTYFEGGVEYVSEIVRVESVDIVTDPATVNGIFEGKTTVSKIKLSELSAKIGPKLGPKKWTRFESVLEMDTAYGDTEVDMPADDEPAEDTLLSAMQTLVAAIVDQCNSGELSPEEAGTKVTAFLNTHLGKEPAAEADDEDDGEDPPAESKKKTAKPLTAEAVADLIAKYIIPLKTEIGELKAEKPKSGGKIAPKTESTDVPTDAKAFKEFVTK